MPVCVALSSLKMLAVTDDEVVFYIVVCGRKSM